MDFSSLFITSLPSVAVINSQCREDSGQFAFTISTRQFFTFDMLEFLNFL